jgi:hypothetical protein
MVRLDSSGGSTPPQLPYAVPTTSYISDAVLCVCVCVPTGFPPGPPGDQTLALLSSPLDFLADMKRKYGPVVGLVLGGERVVLVMESTAARQVGRTPSSTRLCTSHRHMHARAPLHMHAPLYTCMCPSTHARFPSHMHIPLRVTRPASFMLMHTLTQIQLIHACSKLTHAHAHTNSALLHARPMQVPLRDMHTLMSVLCSLNRALCCARC